MKYNGILFFIYVQCTAAVHCLRGGKEVAELYPMPAL